LPAWSRRPRRVCATRSSSIGIARPMTANGPGSPAPSGETPLASSAEERALDKGARAVGRRAHRDPLGPDDTIPRRDLARRSPGRDLNLVPADEMIARALELAYVEEIAAGQFRPGPSRPA
jgi:hypothetical protein